MEDNKRSEWSGAFGFMVALVGSAIGLGNLWKFPYMVGSNGGAVFLFIYLFFCFIAGIPLIMGELCIGRHTRLEPISAFEKLDARFKFVGYCGSLCGILIPAYYSVIGGWVLAYIFRFITYITTGIPDDLNSEFGRFITNPWEPLVWQTMFLAITLYIIYQGVEKGIESYCKIMMPLLFCLLLILVVRSLTLPGAAAGMAFLFEPDFSKINIQTIMNAMGQMFWSVSLGMGIIVTYGSYMRKDTNLVRSAYIIPIADTIAALLAGICIIPAVFAFGIEPTQGPTLTFITLPHVFAKMPLGILFGIIFFVLVLVAALTSNMSLIEVGVSVMMDRYKMTRPRAVLYIGVFTFLLSIPASLSMGIISEEAVLGFLGPIADITLFKLNMFDFLDYITSNVMMMIAGLGTCVYIGYVWGVGNALREITNEGKVKFALAPVWCFLIRYVSPVFMLIVLLHALSII